jgi:hypothetical protein
MCQKLSLNLRRKADSPAGVTSPKKRGTYCLQNTIKSARYLILRINIEKFTQYNELLSGKLISDKKNPLAISAEGNRWVGVGLGKYNKERIVQSHLFQEFIFL